MVPYIEPQEYGNYSQTRWVEFSNDDGAGIRISAAAPFDFSAVPYFNLDRARYLFQLRKDDFVRVDLSYRKTGVGDTPVPVMPQYRTYPQRISNRMAVVPVTVSGD